MPSQKRNTYRKNKSKKNNNKKSNWKKVLRGGALSQEENNRKIFLLKNYAGINTDERKELCALLKEQDSSNSFASSSTEGLTSPIKTPVPSLTTSNSNENSSSKIENYNNIATSVTPILNSSNSNEKSFNNVSSQSKPSSASFKIGDDVLTLVKITDSKHMTPSGQPTIVPVNTMAKVTSVNPLKIALIGTNGQQTESFEFEQENIKLISNGNASSQIPNSGPLSQSSLKNKLGNTFQNIGTGVSSALNGTIKLFDRVTNNKNTRKMRNNSNDNNNEDVESPLHNNPFPYPVSIPPLPLNISSVNPIVTSNDTNSSTSNTGDVSQTNYNETILPNSSSSNTVAASVTPTIAAENILPNSSSSNTGAAENILPNSSSSNTDAASFSQTNDAENILPNSIISNTDAASVSNAANNNESAEVANARNKFKKANSNLEETQNWVKNATDKVTNLKKNNKNNKNNNAIKDAEKAVTNAKAALTEQKKLVKNAQEYYQNLIKPPLPTRPPPYDELPTGPPPPLPTGPPPLAKVEEEQTLQQRLLAKQTQLKDEIAKKEEDFDEEKVKKLQLEVAELNRQLDEMEKTNGGRRQTRKKLNRKKRQSNTKKRRRQLRK